jgi:hypothetical protein
MIKVLLLLALALIFWGIFIWVIFYIEPPKSLTEANLLQIAYFFIPLYLAIIFSVNLLLKSLPASGSIALGIVILLTLKALDLFNFLYVTITLIATLLLFSYFKKDLPSLTSFNFVRKLRGSRRNK